LFVWLKPKLISSDYPPREECHVKEGLLLQKVKAQNYAAIATTTQRAGNKVLTMSNSLNEKIVQYFNEALAGPWCTRVFMSVTLVTP
jgi:hypothetical protein